MSQGFVMLWSDGRSHRQKWKYTLTTEPDLFTQGLTLLKLEIFSAANFGVKIGTRCNVFNKFEIVCSWRNNKHENRLLESSCVYFPSDSIDLCCASSRF
jgi:hypothetical protein